MADLMGIDLNGLRDVSVDSVDRGVLRGGDVPSVVIIQPRQAGASLRAIAGAEAAMAVEGRGWHWPEMARVNDANKRLRIPIKTILRTISQKETVRAGEEEVSPVELLTAAIEALSLPRGHRETAGQDSGTGQCQS